MTRFINEGPDKRFNLFGVVAWLQRLLSFPSGKAPDWAAKSVGLFMYWNPVFNQGSKQIAGRLREYVACGLVYWPFYIVWQPVHQDGKITIVPVSPEHPDGMKWLPGRCSLFRFGWRYDANAVPPTYIFGAAAKFGSEQFPMEKGY